MYGDLHHDIRGREKQKAFYYKYLPKHIQDDFSNMILLVVLYAIQGIPLGLSFGSIPFLLQQTVSKTEIGIFSLVGYPYCLKLLWSPIVDTFYIKKIGRRKSWIIPIQLLSGIVLYYLGQTIDESLKMRPVMIYELSMLFLILILFTATQDIAVDGWAITILSKRNTSYSATCQSVGINIGFFGSFTILLALNSASFCNTYLSFFFGEFNDVGILQIGTYITYSSYLYLIFTIWLLLFKDENVNQNRKPTLPNNYNNNDYNNNYSKSTDYNNNRSNEKIISGDNGDDDDEYFIHQDTSASVVYRQIFELIFRPHIRDLIIVLILSKVAFAAENVSSIELLDRGFKKEDLALFALIDFPLQILYSVIAGKLSSGKNPLLVWLTAYQLRMAIIILIQMIIYFYPKGELPFTYWSLILLYYLLSSATSSIMMVIQSGFFARISDQSIGGTYLTLLNTVSNFGGTWPKLPVLYLIDYFTISVCVDPEGVRHYNIDCNDKATADTCSSLYNGICETEREGFFIVNILCLVIGLVLFTFLISKKLISIQNLQETKWKVKDNLDISDIYVISEY